MNVHITQLIGHVSLFYLQSFCCHRF